VPASSTIRCQSCGSTTAAGVEFCKRCGNDLTSPGLIPALASRDDTAEHTVVIDAYVPADVAGSARVSRPPRRRRRWVGALAVLALALAAAGGYTAYRGYYDGRTTNTAQPRGTADPTTPAAQGAPPPTATQAATGTLPPTITGSSAGAGDTADRPLVAAAPALAGRPETAAVVALLTKYFEAINARDFEAARSTLVSRPELPSNETEFRNEYRSTHDRDVRLLNLSPDGNGGYQALVSFTSFQNAEDAPDKSSTCLVWSMAYPMVPGGTGSLLIDVIGRSAVTYHRC
jgi:hypothetical protein